MYALDKMLTIWTLVVCAVMGWSASAMAPSEQTQLEASGPAPISIRVLTHNIRYATTAPFKGEELWTVRRQRLVNALRFNTAQNPEAFICCQEVLHEQLQDLLGALNSHGDRWEHVGVGRDDGKEAGEYSPIFYRPAVWRLLDFTTIWLSETPDVPSKSWDAASTRILTVGKFEHIRTGVRVLALNTHLDDQGSTSRLESAKIIADRAKTLSRTEEGRPLPVFLTGDFNSAPSQEAYEYITKQSPFEDTFEVTPKAEHYGNKDTFTGFGFEEAPLQRIDFVFVRQEESGGSRDPWTANGYGCLPNRFDDGVYTSDHRAVVVDLRLK